MPASRPEPSPARRPRSLLGAALACAALCACAPDAAEGAAERPAPRWPPGTVLSIGDRPISAAEVARVEDWIRSLQPRSTARHVRRQALIELVLPRAVAAARSPEGRAEALAACRAFRERLEASEPQAELAPPRCLQGDVGLLGLDVWGAVAELPPGRWSEPVEGVGRFVLARRLPPEAGGGEEQGLAVEVHEFRFTPGGAGPRTSEGGFQRDLGLSFVDPEWRDVVPDLWARRFGGGRPE